MLVKKLAQNFICASETKFYLRLQSSRIYLHMRNGHTPLTTAFWRLEANPWWKGWCGCNSDICRGGEGRRAYGQETHGLRCFMFLLPCCRSSRFAESPLQHKEDGVKLSDQRSAGSSLQSSRALADCHWNKKSHLVLSKDDNMWKITNCGKPLYSCFS